MIRKSLLVFLAFIIGRLLFTSSVVAAPPTGFQTTQVVGSGLNGPSGFAIAPDSRIFILERTGAVKIFKNGSLNAQPFITFSTFASGDRGLIGIAFDPDFASNSYVYFYYTGTDYLNHLVRYNASGDLAQNGIELYKTSSPSYELHVGGSIQFGQDGKLYFAVGDNGYPPNAQSLNNPHGKILRINRDGTIPADNPFVGQAGALPEIWAYGLRNPWRFQFDSVTGHLYVGDVGNYTWEEVNHVEKGKNYGWPTCEGYCGTVGMENPIYTYNHDALSSAVTMGPVYRGSMFPTAWQGKLFFADYARGFIRTLPINAQGNAIDMATDFDAVAGSVVDLQTAADGSLYYVTYYPGRIYRISYTPDNQIPVALSQADKTGGNNPLTVQFTSTGSYDPDNTELTYVWNFGDGTISTEANPTKIYANKGSYVVDLKVSDGVNVADATPISITVGTPPTVTISQPVDGSLYQALDTITYNVFGIDGSGFDLNDAGLSTEIIYHHDTHIHPFLGPILGRVGSFTIPDFGEASANTWFEIKVTATDNSGVKTVKSAFIYPKKSTMTFATVPNGLTFTLDGTPYTAPQTVTGIWNFKREIHAPDYVLDGTYYQFDHWSDGGAQKHTITTPETNTTYTAFFNVFGTSGYQAQYFNNVALSGTPALTRTEQKIAFNWEGGSPDPIIQTDNFSARWTKQTTLPGGNYRIVATADDGIRVFIDGNALIDKWIDQAPSTYTKDIHLNAGNHTIIVEYYERGVGATCSVSLDLLTMDVTPTPTLGATPTPTTISTPTPTISGATPTPVVSGTVNLALNKPTVSSGDEDNTLLPPKAVDGNPNTRWGSTEGVDPQWIYVDLGSVTQLSRVKLLWETAYAKNYRIEVSNDAINWTLAYAATNADGGIDDITLNATSGRYVRMYGFARATQWGYSLWELEVYGINNTLPTPTPTLSVATPTPTLIPTPTPTPMSVATPTPTPILPTPTPATTFTGEYFSNKTLSGTPTVIRQDPVINFAWQHGSPHPFMSADNFSVRWTKTEAFNAGTYRFTMTGDDGIRLTIDGNIVIDKFIDQSAKTYTADVLLTQGNHVIIMEFYEAAGEALAKLSYTILSSAPTATPTPTLNGPTPTPTLIPTPTPTPMSGPTPTPTLVPTPTPTPMSGTTPYTGEYHNGKQLFKPTPDLVRQDSEINFDWGDTSPGGYIWKDNFTVRWTKTTVFEAGTYRFTMTSDDGAKLIIDGSVVLDKWVERGVTTDTIDVPLTAGNHTIVMEYFEAGGEQVAKLSYNKL